MEWKSKLMKKLGFSGIAVILVFTFLFGQSPTVEIVGYPRLLSNPGDYFISPKWSPDGTTIAVSGEKYTGIYLISFPDGKSTLLTEEKAAGFGMEWSHNGNTIAARIARFNGYRRYNALTVFEVTTGTEHIISDFTTVMPGIPKWTKNDKYVYLNGSDKFRLYSTNNANIEDETISLPDEKILYIKNDLIHRREISKRTEYAVNAPEGRIINLTVSPDGKMIAYEVLGGNLWISDVDGKNLVDLGLGYSPEWAPDNRKITYMITADDGHRYVTSDIFVVNIDGTGKVNITNTEDIIEMHPCWSPDGRWIAYDTVKGEIYVLEVR